MSTIAETDNLLATAGAILALLAALVGVVTGVAQLTGKARARRAFEWSSKALESEPNGSRKATLSDIRTRSLGYLIGAHYVPSWKFTEHIFWLLVGPPLVFLLARSTDDAITSISGLVSYVLFMSIVGRRALRLYAERTRTIRQYISGHVVRLPETRMLHQMEGGTRTEFVIGFLASIGLTVASISIAWFLNEGLAFRGLSIPTFMAGLALSWFSLVLARRYTLRWAGVS